MYKRQWFTLSGAYDRKFYVLKGDHHFIGAGASLNHDRQGDSKLNLTSLTVNGAYHRILAPEHIVSAGPVSYTHLDVYKRQVYVYT